MPPVAKSTSNMLQRKGPRPSVDSRTPPRSPRPSLRSPQSTKSSAKVTKGASKKTSASVSSTGNHSHVGKRQLEGEVARLRELQGPTTELAERLNAAAWEEESRIKELMATQPLIVRLGELLQKQQVRAIDLLRTWDLNNDGVVSKEEFHDRMCMLSLRTTVAESDALFEDLDDDRSGFLELTELKYHLHRMTGVAAHAKAELASMQDQVRLLRQRGRLADQVSSALNNGEASAEKTLQRRPSLTAKLGSTLPMTMKPAELLKSWDTISVDGVVSRIEFRSNVSSLLPEVDYREIDSLFADFDQDHSNYLELNEITSMLKILTVAAEEEAAASAEEIEKQRDAMEELQARAMHAHKVLLAIEAADAEEARLCEQKAQGPPLVVQLGELFCRRHTKPIELLHSWDTNSDGAISKEEFWASVQQNGLVASYQEIE